MAAAAVKTAKTSAKSKKGPLKPVNVILSEQPFLRRQPLDRLYARLDAELGADSYDTQTFEGGEALATDIVAAAQTVPFLSSARLIVVNNLQAFSADQMEILAGYVAEPNPTTILVLIGEKLLKTSKLYKAAQATGYVMERQTPKANELPGLLRSMFQAAGLTADDTVARAVINLVGNDLVALSVATEKLKAFCGDRTQVTRDDVAQVIGATVEVRAWEFTNAVAERACNDALGLLYAMFEQNDREEAVLAMVRALTAQKIRELLCARALLDRGCANASELNARMKLLAAKPKNIPDWLARKTFTQAERYSAAELRDALVSLAEVERQKTSRPELGRLAFERWVLEVLA
ncbi:MAG: DNA polymerase III subunit delta [Actinomycetes bacterium]|jgi:DNA polymerase-3 subunit delta|nr:DNA polymerase III subunit delta [Actinomycetes bacterium]